MRDLLERIDRRTWLGIGLSGLAAFLVLVVTRPAPTVNIVVAANDVPAGTRIAELDLRTLSLPTSVGFLLESELEALAGWTLAEPLEAGEPILPSLLRAPQLSGNPDLFALSVESAHAVLGRISAGDAVDIYVTWDATDETERLAEAVYVVEARTTEAGFSEEQVQMLLAVDQELAAQLTRAIRTGEIDVVRQAS